MRQSIILCNLIALSALSACSSLPELAPAAPSQTAREQAPQVLPPALRKAAYDAPEWNPSPGAQQVPVTDTYVVQEPPSGAYAPRPQIRAGAAPEALEAVTPSSVRYGETAVPQAPRGGRSSYQPRADLSALDSSPVTQGRAPRAPSAQVTPPSRQNAYTPAPRAAVASVPAASPADNFGGNTASIMAEATPTPRRQYNGAGSYSVHLASYRNPSNVTKGWAILQRQHPNMLAGMQARGASVSIPGKGDFIRLLVGPFETPADAKRLCYSLKSMDEYCKVMPFTGRPIS